MRIDYVSKQRSLRRAVPYGQGVAPICVPETTGNDSEYKGRSANVAGWGELYYGELTHDRVHDSSIISPRSLPRDLISAHTI